MQKNENIGFLKRLLWWFHVMTREKDSSSQIPYTENAECHLLYRENSMAKKISDNWEFISVISSNTGNIHGHNIHHVI